MTIAAPRVPSWQHPATCPGEAAPDTRPEPEHLGHGGPEAGQCEQCRHHQHSERSHHARILNPFFRFIHRFSGRRRGGGGCKECGGETGTSSGCDSNHPHPHQHHQHHHHHQPQQYSQAQLCLLYLVLVTFLSCADACSSRSTPRPRPPSPTMRPNITFQTYACPPAYAAWYCLNGATCFTVKIGRSILYNCECADGFMGQRCEFKDLDGTYVSSSERLRQAAAAGSLSAASWVQTASTNVFVGGLVIVLATALAALVFTNRRSRAKMRKIQEIRERTLEHSSPSLSSSSSPPPSLTASPAPALDASCHQQRPQSPPRGRPASPASTQSPPAPTPGPGRWWRRPGGDPGQLDSVMRATISYAMAAQPPRPRPAPPHTHQVRRWESEV